MPSRIDAATTIGSVALSVANLERSLGYYTRHIGLVLLDHSGDSATLGVATKPLLRLHAIEGARLIRRATGLYHIALRVPSRRDLALVIRHFADTNTQIGGAADHLFSEALYLSDPDGHGIEIYHDRPRDTWFDEHGNLRGASDPLNMCAILNELHASETVWHHLPPGTDVGHIHLQVADIAAAEHFYLDVLGFERMTSMPSASFVSAGGYHHHIGMNTWAGTGISPPPENAARLLSYEVLLPNQAALDEVLTRIRAAEITLGENAEGVAVRDPSHNLVVLRLSEASSSASAPQ